MLRILFSSMVLLISSSVYAQSTSGAEAEIYKCKKKDGSSLITNIPCDKQGAALLKTLKVVGVQKNPIQEQVLDDFSFETEKKNEIPSSK